MSRLCEHESPEHSRFDFPADDAVFAMKWCEYGTQSVAMLVLEGERIAEGHAIISLVPVSC